MQCAGSCFHMLSHRKIAQVKTSLLNRTQVKLRHFLLHSAHAYNYFPNRKLPAGLLSMKTHLQLTHRGKSAKHSCSAARLAASATCQMQLVGRLPPAKGGGLLQRAPHLTRRAHRHARSCSLCTTIAGPEHTPPVNFLLPPSARVRDFAHVPRV